MKIRNPKPEIRNRPSQNPNWEKTAEYIEYAEI